MNTQPWRKFFIGDTSVKFDKANVAIVNGVPRPNFGRCFTHFHETEAQFSVNPDKVKLFDTIEAADIEFDKIPNMVCIFEIIILTRGNEIKVSHRVVKNK